MCSLPRKAVHDRRIQRFGEPEQFGVSACGSRAAEDGHARSGVEDVRRAAQRLVVRTQHRSGRQHRSGVPLAVGKLGLEHLAGDHQYRDTVLLDRGAHRDLDQAWGHLRCADQLAVDAALAEQLLRMRFLEVSGADLAQRDVRSDRQHRHPGALGVVETVDQMRIARPAAAGTHRQPTGQRRVGGRGEGRRLLVAHVLPRDVLGPSDRVGEPVETVAR